MTAPVDQSLNQPAAAAGDQPWPEPWRHQRGRRPRTEYWDVATASWHRDDPARAATIPAPRRGD